MWQFIIQSLYLKYKQPLGLFDVIGSNKKLLWPLGMQRQLLWAKSNLLFFFGQWSSTYWWFMRRDPFDHFPARSSILPHHRFIELAQFILAVVWYLDEAYFAPKVGHNLDKTNPKENSPESYAKIRVSLIIYSLVFSFFIFPKFLNMVHSNHVLRVKHSV